MLSREQFYVIEKRDGKVFESYNSGADLMPVSNYKSRNNHTFIGGAIIRDFNNLEINKFDEYHFFDIYGNEVQKSFIEKSHAQNVYLLRLRSGNKYFIKKFIYVK